MNTASTKRPLAAALGGLSLFLLALCGCTDHGPVGLYSQELFGKKIPLAHLTFSSTVTGITVVSTGQGSSAGNPQGVIVSLVNDGGSATYGPINVTFTASGDGNFFLNRSNIICPGTNLDTCYDGVAGPATATYGGGNTEIPAGGGSPFTLIAGYISGPNTVQTTATGAAFHFWVNSTGGGAHNVKITMAIIDALGSTYNSSFDLPEFNY